MLKKNENIITTAQQLFIEKGYYSVSVQDILDASDISKGTFYNYFQSKNDLILTILQRFKDEVHIERTIILQKGDIDDKKLLIEQLKIKFSLYKKYHIFSLYQALFLERNQKLNNLIFQQRVDEVNWFAQRLVDIYGDRIKDYSIDLATHCLGAITYQMQFADMIKMGHKSCASYIQYNFAFLECALPKLLTEPFTLFPKNSIDFLDNADSTKPENIYQKIVETLNELKEQTAMDKNDIQEILGFIAAEIKKEQPQFAVLSTVVRSFSSNHALNPELSFKTTQLLQFLHTYQRYK